MSNGCLLIIDVSGETDAFGIDMYDCKGELPSSCCMEGNCKLSLNLCI